MIRREDRRQIQTVLEIVQVVCDRCGRDLDWVSGIGVRGDWEVKGCYVRGDKFPSHNAGDILRIDAELCADCTDDLVVWIDKGEGPGARVRTSEDKVREMMPL